MSQRTRRHLSVAPSPDATEQPDLSLVPGGRSADALPDNLVGMLLEQAQRLYGDDDPMQVELWCSDVLGAVWLATGADPAAETAFAGAWTVAAEEVGGVAGLCALLALARMCGDADVREQAARAADHLVSDGVAPPRWTDTVDDLTVGECWRYGDVFGDQETVFCAFGRGDGDHAMLVLIDHTLGGLAKDVFFTDGAADSLTDLRAELAATPVAFLEPLDAAAARARLERAFATTDAQVEPRFNDDLPNHRAMALARVRAMPDARPLGVESAGDPDALVAEFLRSAHASALPDQNLARRWAELFVTRALDRDDAPARVGPGMLDELLLFDVPGHAILDAPARRALPGVATAWTRWASSRQGLSTVATEWLESSLEEVLEEFPEAYRDSEAAAHRNSCPAVVDLRTPRQPRRA